MKLSSKIAISSAIAGLLLVGLASMYSPTNEPASPLKFDGTRALQDVDAQMSYGPRIPRSQAHEKTRSYIIGVLEAEGWTVRSVQGEIINQVAYNLVATRSNTAPVILLGAHYDSRIFADKDTMAWKRTLPVPGANDGASGVAVLLELARSLPTDGVPVGLVFFDIEDNGGIPGYDWIMGSRVFAAADHFQPRAVVILDMVGDKDLNIFMEAYSDTQLTNQIWSTAAVLGYGNTFIPTIKHTILDDHVPFLEKGIPAVDVIDIDYDYWHTTEDTSDKISAASLQIVGDTILRWIRDYGPCLAANTCE